ncbi:MAG: hypothetical protein JO115_22710 [Pseudonocardiales bacterium]|nr:hypothetical protein [Pseudonocardiales bacterium]
MPQDHASPTSSPRLDDLLAMMGITREQLVGMTADDLFAAATRWQNATAIAKAARCLSPLDRLIDSLPVPSASLAMLN